MKLKSEVVKQECYGDEAAVTLGNVRKIDAAEWREYSASISIRLPFSKLRNYPIGRTVIIELTPK